MTLNEFILQEKGYGDHVMKHYERGSVYDTFIKGCHKANSAEDIKHNTKEIIVTS